jgi:hypothetical protein
MTGESKLAEAVTEAIVERDADWTHAIWGDSPTIHDPFDAAAQVERQIAEAVGAALEAAARTYCVNCDSRLPLSDGKNKMHIGGLYCYAWAIRALNPAAIEAVGRRNDEIEHLRLDLNLALDQVAVLTRDIERLRAALEQIRSTLSPAQNGYRKICDEALDAAAHGGQAQGGG